MTKENLYIIGVCFIEDLKKVNSYIKDLSSQVLLNSFYGNNGDANGSFILEIFGSNEIGLKIERDLEKLLKNNSIVRKDFSSEPFIMVKQKMIEEFPEYPFN